MALPSRWLSVSVTATVVALLALTAAESSLACTCARTPLKQRIVGSDAAITARLLDVVQRKDRRDYIYRVRRVRKGAGRLSHGDLISVIGSSSGTGSGDSCSAPAKIGAVYGILLYRDKGRWSTNLCSVFTPAALTRPRCL